MLQGNIKGTQRNVFFAVSWCIRVSFIFYPWSGWIAIELL